MGELVPYDELLDSGRLDWLWDGRLQRMSGYTSWRPRDLRAGPVVAVPRMRRRSDQAMPHQERP